MTHPTRPTECAKYIFREVRDAAELLELLRLRYRVYRESRLSGFVKESTDQIDVDCFDAFSKHYGIYCDGRAIGCMRVVETFSTKADELMQELSTNFETIRVTVEQRRTAILPCATYGEFAEPVDKEVGSYLSRNQRIVEPSRLMVDPSARSRRMAQFVIESAIALYFYGARPSDAAILGCCSSQKRFYNIYGFEQVTGTTECFKKEARASATILIAHPEDVPAKVAPRIQRMSDEFERTGQIVYRTTGGQNRRDSKHDNVRQATAVA